MDDFFAYASFYVNDVDNYITLQDELDDHDDHDDHGDEHGDDDHDDHADEDGMMITMTMMITQILYMLIMCKKMQNSEDTSLNLVEHLL